MKIRTAIVAFTLLAGGAATTFAGERHDHREVIVRHDAPVVIRHDRDFHRDPVVRFVPGCTIVCDR